jgi:hypothetical protein
MEIVALNPQSINIQFHAVVPKIEEILRIIASIIGAGNTNFAKKIDLNFRNLFREIRFISA